MAATKMFFITRFSSSIHLKVDLSILDMYICVFYKNDLPVSRLKDNALDDFQEVFLEVIWTSWKSFGRHGSLLMKFSSISSEVQACLCRGMIYNSFTTYTLVVSSFFPKRLTCKSSKIRRFDQNLGIKSWKTYM
ncbi:hypothetical protein IGI04_007100 [Brassica rapa subsp. trilocularis]|uniref:Uncharacterized protein n=1 Tax=Brassica rapa subsp. trilocularis TaxID=1813537 RepID=A0ABQ7NKV8_BRACM|nr:hypothetical protein IGI04_007100 [Brassica rapa subsp. trilocularis]